MAAAATAALLAAGCSDDVAGAGSSPSRGPSSVPSSLPSSAPSSVPDRVPAVLDGVRLLLEVADDRAERAVGLMRRTSVPPGTGMVFLYDEPSEGRFYMFDVPVPLRAVFIRNGRVVSTVVMPPCEEPVARDCPTYGADGPFDTVVETAPETLPDVAPGDAFVLGG